MPFAIASQLKQIVLVTCLCAAAGVVMAQDGPGPKRPEETPTTLPKETITVPSDIALAQFYTQFNAQNFLLSHAYAYRSNNTVSTTDPKKDPNGPCAQNRIGKPIDISKGTKLETYPLFALPGEMGLKYELYYHSRGINAWSDDSFYWLDTSCGWDGNYKGGVCPGIQFYRADGSTILFNGGVAVGPFTEAGGGGLATLTYDKTSSTYTLQDEDATTKVFDSNGKLLSTKDASGIGWTFNSSQANGVTTMTVTHTNGQSMTIASGPTTITTVNGNAVTSTPIVVTDPAGNVYQLHQGSGGYDSIALPDSPATTLTLKYVLTALGAGLSEVDYNGTPYTYTSYRSDTSAYNGWATGTYLADGTEHVSIVYTTDFAGNVSAAVTNDLGHQSTQTYDGTNGGGTAYNGLMSAVSDSAVADCGATNRAQTYDANGNISQITDNNGNIHKLTYAANGQLQTETEAYGTAVTRTTDYVWDPNQQLNRPLSITVEGRKKTVYTYNAQNRLASVAVTNLSGTGTANQTLTTTYNYTLYSNGMVQTMSVTHPSPGNSDTDVSSYDALGNLTSLANGLGQTTTYSNYTALGEAQHVVGPNGDVTDYTYDARGRIATKKTYPYGITGTWTYGYDGFGLLASLTTPDNETTTWNRDPEMRVTTITRNDKDGTSTETFGYDAHSDVTSHTIARGSDVSLSETANFDALGRLYQKFGAHGQSWTYAYDGNGNVLSVTDAVGHVTSYQYDALDRVSQKTESGGGASPAIPATAPTINVPSSNTSGAYTVSWNSISGATTYPLQEQVNGGGWTPVQNNTSISWGASGKTSNTYGYRVQACNVSGCSVWSSVGTVSVSIPTAPTSAPALTVPSSSTTGNYTVSWTSTANTSTYNLQEQVNGGGWTTAQSSTALNWTASGKGSANYGYRVQACNALGCGPWSGTGTINVAIPPPPATPATPSTPANNANGSYTVSWNAVSGATSYPVQQQINGGSWSVIQNSVATSWSASGESNGTYSYEVQACGAGGCSGWSSAATTVVTIPVPIAINGKSYGVSYIVPKGAGTDTIGFDIVGGNTWEVYTSKPGTTHGVTINGAVPAGATTVQYTWTDAGVPGGDRDAKGSVTNNAASPTAISSNPGSQYTTSSIASNVPSSGHQYQLRVDFFNAAGNNISSSTCTLTAEITGSAAEVVHSGAN